ncbi:MAG TPA: hypothetical protein GXX51_04065 [Firmicutes bacterium]|nr:hypothetical protein [Bacillota bacterium]
MPDENNRGPMDVLMSLINSQVQGGLDPEVLIGVLALVNLLSIVNFLNPGARLRGQGSVTLTDLDTAVNPGSDADNKPQPSADPKALGEFIGNLMGRMGQGQAQGQVPDVGSLINMLASQMGSKMNPNMLPALINLLSAYVKQKGASPGQGQAGQKDQKDRGEEG